MPVSKQNTSGKNGKAFFCLLGLNILFLPPPQAMSFQWTVYTQFGKNNWSTCFEFVRNCWNEDVPIEILITRPNIFCLPEHGVGIFLYTFVTGCLLIFVFIRNLHVAGGVLVNPCCHLIPHTKPCVTDHWALGGLIPESLEGTPVSRAGPYH